MARPNFHYTPRENADFDVCSTPPPPAAPGPALPAAEPAQPGAQPPPKPAEG
jgi:hypothetical protein